MLYTYSITHLLVKYYQTIIIILGAPKYVVLWCPCGLYKKSSTALKWQVVEVQPWTCTIGT